MLIRGQTTEERIGEIANKFSQGLSSYAQSQRQEAEGMKEERKHNEALELKKEEYRQKAADRQRAIKKDDREEDAYQTEKKIKEHTLGELLKPLEETKDYKKSVAVGKAREEVRVAAEERALNRRKEQDRFEAVDSIRKEVSTFKPVKDMQDVDVALSKIQSAPPTAAGDMSLIYGQMKIFDPGTGVKEGEYATAEQARGMDSSLLATYQKVVSGQRLTPAQREDFKKTAVKLAHSQYKNFAAATAPHRNRLKELGVDERQVLPTFSQQQSYDSSSQEEAEINRMNELRAKRQAGG